MIAWLLTHWYVTIPGGLLLSTELNALVLRSIIIPLSTSYLVHRLDDKRKKEGKA